MGSFAVSDEDLAFHEAYSAFKLAGTDEERSAAGVLLRAELERTALALDETLKMQKQARSDEFDRELALLKAKFQAELKRKDDAAAIRKAVVELCMSKIETDPDEAALICKAVLGWSTKWKPLNSCADGLFGDTWKGPMEEYSDGWGPSAAPRALVRIGKMTPQELYRISANAQNFLKSKGRNVPIQEMQESISGSVKMEEARRSDVKFWKEAVGWVGAGCGIVSAALTTVEAVKNLEMSMDVEFEPLLNCRHFLPPGWYF